MNLFTKMFWSFTDSNKEETYAHTEPFEYSSELIEPVKDFQLKNKNGKINLIGWDKKTIEVKAIKKVESSSKEITNNIIKELAITINKTHNKIDIQTLYPSQDGCKFKVDFDIKLPASININLYLLNATINVQNFNSSINIENKNGNCSVDKFKGNLNINNLNGNLKGNLELNKKTFCEMTTLNGNIDIKIDSKISASIEANVTNGFIKINKKVEGNFLSSKKFNGNINGNSGRIKLSTLNGIISIS